jgi:xanthine dehydrogenase YagS FAD-binding subunit
MRPISYARVSDTATAIAMVSADPDSAYLAGGTNEIDLLRIDVNQHRLVVDINDLPLQQISDLPGGGLWIGGLARMSEVALSPLVREAFPMLAQALELGASPQLRNMASMAGNLMQRTRCGYFRDGYAACNKRRPGTGCAAMNGINRGHAVLGTSQQCIATHPSDLAVALVALDAVLHIEGRAGPRTVPLDDFFLLPGTTPDREHAIGHGELIVAIEVPAAPIARRSLYLKVADRQSYEFALASAAIALELDGGVNGGLIGQVRLALGGVATKPWRARRAEEILTGAPATPDTFAEAAAAELAEASIRQLNHYKIGLAQRTIVRALEMVTAKSMPA